MNELELFKKTLISKRKDIKSIQAYISDTSLFLDFTQKDIDKIDYFDIENYKSHLINNDYKITSINRKMVSINSFLKSLGYNVEVKQEKIAMQLFLENLISKDEVDRMIEVIETHRDYRAKCLIYTLMLTGVRIFECLQLNISDIDKDTITILGKGKKYRQILVSDKLRKVWQEYARYRINKTNKLFTGKRGVLTPQTCNKILKYYGELANVDINKCHNHMFRHYFCSTLSSIGVSIDTIGDLAGHSNINTTRIYTRKTKDQLLDTINSI